MQRYNMIDRRPEPDRTKYNLWHQMLKELKDGEPKTMFNTEEVGFIEETAKKDLVSINAKIESMVNDMARIGKNLSDIKVVQSKLQNILASIDQQAKNKERIHSRCC